jgi:hypothetical protein
MLKIWLTWLQPSLGVLGTALVLSNPFCVYATTKPAAPRNTTKIPTQFSPWSVAKSNGTRIDRELATGVAITPDVAVRQLAIDSMVTPGTLPAKATAKARQGKLSAGAKFVSPATRVQKLSAKAPKQTKQNEIAAEIARALNPKSAIPVPGIYVPTPSVRTATKTAPTAPTIKPVTQPMSSAVEIGAPTPLAAMMSAKPSVDPFPVVRPELMQKLPQQAATKAPVTAASVPTVKATAKNVLHSLDPIATIPAGPSKAKTVNLKAAAPHSLDPIATIPSGLQKLLGNNLNGKSTTASARVAKAITIKPNAVLALKQLVAPTVAMAPTSVSDASLRLATAQAYSSVAPKFSIPGETILTSKAVKRNQQDLTAAVVGRKSNYVARLTPVKKQPWTVVNQRNNLGGLILGSQPVYTVTKVVSLTPTNTLKASAPGDVVDIN